MFHSQNLQEIEEANEYGDLKDMIGTLPPPGEGFITAPPSKMRSPYSAPVSNKGSPAAGATKTAISAATPASPSPAAKKEPAATSSAFTATEAPKKQDKENAPLPIRNSLATEAAAEANARKQKKLEEMKASLKADEAKDSTPTSNEVAAESTGSLTSPMKSPRSAPTSTSNVISPQSSNSEPAVSEVRGRRLSSASAKEMKEIEDECRIPEAPDEDEEDTQAATIPAVKVDEDKPTVSEEKEKEKEAPKPALRPSKTQQDLEPLLAKISAARSDENVAKERSNSAIAEAAQASESSSIQSPNRRQASPLSDADASSDSIDASATGRKESHVAASKLAPLPPLPKDSNARIEEEVEARPEPGADAARPPQAQDEDENSSTEPRADPVSNASVPVKANDTGDAQRSRASDVDRVTGKETGENVKAGKAERGQETTQAQAAGEGHEAGESVED